MENLIFIIGLIGLGIACVLARLLAAVLVGGVAKSIEGLATMLAKIDVPLGKIFTPSAYTTTHRRTGLVFLVILSIVIPVGLALILLE